VVDIAIDKPMDESRGFGYHVEFMVDQWLTTWASRTTSVRPTSPAHAGGNALTGNLVFSTPSLVMKAPLPQQPELQPFLWL